MTELATIKPEYVSHIELGVKTKPFKKTTANAVIYNTNINDYQTQVQAADLSVNRGYLANADKVTLRQLLNHTSGIPDVIEQNSFYLQVLNNPGRFWTPVDLLKEVKGVDAVFPLGTQLEYSNTNLLYAAMAIEGATGQNHARLLREKILDPLNLKNTYYHWHEALPDFVAQGYFDLYNNNTLVNISNFNTGSGNGYGGLYSTVFDLQRFIEALLRDKTLLKPATLQEMIRITAEDLPELDPQDTPCPRSPLSACSVP